MLLRSLIVSVLLGQTIGYSQSFDDCMEFAKRFDNTCDPEEGPKNPRNIPSADVNCQNIDKCAGTFSNGVCTFQRKLCVSCIDKAGTTYIHVTTNGFPNHCTFAPVAGKETFADYEVKWNWDVGTKQYSSAKTQNELDSSLCNLMWPRDTGIPADADYKLFSPQRVDTMIAVSLSGGFIFSALSINNVDPFYPNYYGDVTNLEEAKEGIDTCLMHPEFAGTLHYHIPSPCIVDPETYGFNVKPCDAPNTGCSTNIMDYALKGFSNFKSLTPIGIAKDGHIIWGPYKDDGTIFDDCDVDICNGAVIDGSYGYVSTMFFPYFAGCWGPGNRLSVSQSCSTNGRSCPSDPSPTGSLSTTTKSAVQVFLGSIALLLTLVINF